MIINCFKTAYYRSIFRAMSSVEDRAFCERSKWQKTANYKEY